MSENSSVLHLNWAKPIEDMQWEKETRQVQEPNFEFMLAPNPGLNNKEGSPNKLDSGRGPMAMSFDLKLGWTAEKLGPKSGHWKQLARGMKVVPTHNEISPINQIREGLTMLKELNLNVCVQKRRNGTKQINLTPEEVKERDGGEAMTTMQHRQAP